MRQKPSFSCRIEQLEETTVLRVEGEIDLTSAPVFEQWVRDALNSGVPVTVDLRSVSYMDSQGLRALESANTAKVKMTILVTPGALRKLFEISRMEGLHALQESDLKRR